MSDYTLTLLKKDREWTIVREGNKHKTLSGKVGGSITETRWTSTAGRGINTDDEQAQAAVERKIKLKREGGWSEDGKGVPMVDGRPHEEPTLAWKWRDYAKKVSYPCYTSPKLDGIRCIIDKDGMWSRKGKEFVAIPHIRKELQPLFDKHPDLILDGELYNHSLREDFDSISGIVKRKNVTPADLAEAAKIMEYWVFDIKAGPSVDATTTFENRYHIYRGLLMEEVVGAHGRGWKEKFPSVKAVQQFIVKDAPGVVKSCKQFIKGGFEGGMIRNANAPYIVGRTVNLLKYKEFIDDEFEIVDITEGAGNRSGMMGRIFMKTGKNHPQGAGHVFKASAEGSHTFFTKLWEKRADYIGQCATVKFQNWTPRGVPRFGTVIAIRDYE